MARSPILIPDWYYVTFATPDRWLGSCLVAAMSEQRAVEVAVESKIAPDLTPLTEAVVQRVPPDEMINPGDCYRLITDRSEVERIVGECLLG